MGFFKELVGKVKDKTDELGKKAAKKAAEVAIEQSAKAVKSAVGSASRAIETALFGDAEKEKAEQAAREKAARPDPFAKLKAAEAAAKKKLATK